MQYLRGVAIVLAVALVGQSVFDRCLLTCHVAAAGAPAHCHDDRSDSATPHLVDASGCAHDHEGVSIEAPDWQASGHRSADQMAPSAVAVDQSLLTVLVLYSADAQRGVDRSPHFDTPIRR